MTVMLRIPETAVALWLAAQVVAWIEALWREVIARLEGAL